MKSLKRKFSGTIERIDAEVWFYLVMDIGLSVSQAAKPGITFGKDAAGVVIHQGMQQFLAES